MDLNDTDKAGIQCIVRLPLREGVDLNMDCHASAIAVLGLPLREGVDLNPLILDRPHHVINVSLCVREWI